MTEQTKAIMSTITIVAGLALIGYLAFLRVDAATMAAPGIVIALVSWFTRAPERKDPPSGMTIVPLVAAGALIAALVACGCDKSLPPAANVENAAAVAQYELLLADCRAKGKASKSYDVYEDCKDDVNAELCRTAGLRCKDGGK